MAASPPRTRPERRRRRARRGSVERPVSGRIYRATWSLVAIPLLVAAFTVARPQSLPAPALPPSFDEATAAGIAVDFADRFPDRTPGTAGAAEAAHWVRDRLVAYGLDVREQVVTADVAGRGTVTLVNVIAETPDDGGRSREAILVLAHRDNLDLSPGVDDNGSGTAALIELARTLSTVSLQHRVVFVSTDGGSEGNLGAAALAADASLLGPVLAVVNVSAIGGSGPARLQLAGDDARSPAGELLATADAAIESQTEAPATHAGAAGQLVDLAFPFSLYDHAPFLGAGTSAVTVTSAGNRPPRPSDDTAESFDRAALGALGRAAQDLVGSLDSAAEIAQGTESYVYLGGRYVRGFAIELLLVVAILPALAATIDLAARVRRRGLPLAPAWRSFRSRMLVWLWLGGIAALFRVVGLFPGGSPRPLSPDTGPGVDWPVLALLGLGLLGAAGWLVARPRLLPRRAVERADELAGHLVVMLVLCAVSVAVAIVNPFSLLLVLPSLHAWLWVPHVRDRPWPARVPLYAVGFAGPAIVLVSFGVRYGLGLDAPWYVFTLFSVGYAPLVLFLAFLPWAAAAGMTGAIAFGRYAPYPEPGERPARGPLREALHRAAGAARTSRYASTR